jgi:hypothetical protein
MGACWLAGATHSERHRRPRTAALATKLTPATGKYLTRRRSEDVQSSRQRVSSIGQLASIWLPHSDLTSAEGNNGQQSD